MSGPSRHVSQKLPPSCAPQVRVEDRHHEGGEGAETTDRDPHLVDLLDAGLDQEVFVEAGVVQGELAHDSFLFLPWKDSS